MWEVIKGWFIEPTTDAALGTLAKTVKKLDGVAATQGKRAVKAGNVAAQKTLEREWRAVEADRAVQAAARINKLVNGE